MRGGTDGKVPSLRVRAIWERVRSKFFLRHRYARGVADAAPYSGRDRRCVLRAADGRPYIPRLLLPVACCLLPLAYL